jgi:hypothetical protein
MRCSPRLGLVAAAIAAAVWVGCEREDDAQGARPNVAGTWQLTLTPATGAAPARGAMTLSQAGARLKGTSSFGDVDGSISEHGAVELHTRSPWNRSSLLSLEGALVEGTGRMEGAIIEEGLDIGRWGAER